MSKHFRVPTARPQRGTSRPRLDARKPGQTTGPSTRIEPADDRHDSSGLPWLPARPKSALVTTDLMADPTDLVDVEEFRAAAERVMPEAYRALVNNVGRDETLRDDLVAWRGMQLRPRALTDVSAVDASAIVLGRQISA